MNSANEDSMTIPFQTCQHAGFCWPLKIQRFLSLVFLVPTYFFCWVCMCLVFRYKVPALNEIRQRFHELAMKAKGPLIICSNHLTMVDSIILVWVLGSPWYFMRKFSLLPWNLPEKTNFYNNPFSRLICYLGKCLPVVRGGSKEERKKTMDRVLELLEAGESIMIFPEGTRSRKGIVDVENFSYAVGMFVQMAENATVVCVYLRGSKQNTYSNYPCYNDEFYTDIKEIHPKSFYQGLRGVRDLSTQIVHALADMEKGCFEHKD